MHMSGMAGADDAAAPSFMQNLLTAIGSYQALQTQRDLSKINLTRIQQGLPVITYDQIPGSVPTVQVQADIAPGTKSQLSLGLIMVLGVAAIVLLTRKK